MSGLKKRAGAIYFLYGAVSLLAQVILLRRLLSVFYGNELTIGALFSGWMFWTGIGGLLFSKVSDRSKKPESAFSLLMLICAFLFLLSASATWFLRFIFNFNPAFLPGLEKIVLAGFVISAPTCILLGAGFNYASRMFESDEENLVRLYLWEALGSSLSGIVFSLAMAGRISAFAQIVICAFLISLVSAIEFQGWKRKVIALLSIILFVLLLIFSGIIEQKLVKARWQGQEPILEIESRYSTITLTRSAGQVNFWLDSLPAFSYPNTEIFEQIAHLPLSMCAKPEKILLIGGGFSGSAQEIFKHPVKELIYIQIDPALTELERKYVPVSGMLAKDSRLKIIHQDARIFLSQTKQRFDAIIVNLPDPDTANINRYYTREFFQVAKSKLSPDGVLGFSIGGSGNYLSDGQASILANSLLTIRDVFPKIALLPLGRNYIMASENSAWVTENPDEIVARLKERGVRTRFVREYYLKSNLTEERIKSVKESAKRFLNQPANTDLKPRGYYLSALLWLEQANPQWRSFVKKIIEISKRPLFIALLGYCLIAFVLVFRQGLRAFALLSIFAVGFAGISAELVLILGFQVAYGYVYHWLGILISGFMAGLAPGAYFYQKYQRWFSRARLKSLTLVLLGEALAMLVSITGLRLMVHYTPGEFITLSAILFLLILVAFFSGISFPLCANLFLSAGMSGIGHTAGWINAWDHLGSCVGALLTGLVFIPLFGLQFSLFFFALLMLAGLLPILLLRKKSS